MKLHKGTTPRLLLLAKQEIKGLECQRCLFSHGNQACCFFLNERLRKEGVKRPAKKQSHHWCMRSQKRTRPRLSLPPHSQVCAPKSPSWEGRKAFAALLRLHLLGLLDCSPHHSLQLIAPWKPLSLPWQELATCPKKKKGEEGEAQLYGSCHHKSSASSCKQKAWHGWCHGCFSWYSRW